MALLIGIDTGGTYTDAVLLDEKQGILASAKSLTTKSDLAVGIRNSLTELLPSTKPHIHLVSLSSTLATNAVIEGKGRAAGLILIGYDNDILKNDMFASIKAENRIFLVEGGHHISGKEQASLDKNRLKKIVEENESYVSSFAVSGYFSVRNPLHELEAKSIIRKITHLPVTCGHELTSSLDAPKRAVTTLLNARLIPLLYELINSVKEVLKEFNINAPLMIVKGDGSLISSHAALEVPVETILSGPAASIAGAQYLTDEKDALIIDMGGTTSDLAVLKQGRPAVSENNPDIGGFHPMVESIDIFTKGIGGDSMIKANTGNHIHVGPERVIPLCLLGNIHPEILNTLKNSSDHKKAEKLPLFVYKEKSVSLKDGVSSSCSEVLDLLDPGPLFVPDILNKSRYPSVYEQSVRFLIKEGIISASSFTPTDAVAILGYYLAGSLEAASIGAELIAKRFNTDVKTLCDKTVAQIRHQLGKAMIDCAIRYENSWKKINSKTLDSFFIHKALKGEHHEMLSCSIMLGSPIIALGAPAGTYLPEVASLLNCSIIVPKYSDVANAIGAVTGTITQNVRVLIKPIHGGKSYKVHTGQGISIFDKYDKAEYHAITIAKKDSATKALAAGADNVEININKKTLRVNSSAVCEENEILIETEIMATAVGRPRMAGYGDHDA